MNKYMAYIRNVLWTVRYGDFAMPDWLRQLPAPLLTAYELLIVYVAICYLPYFPYNDFSQMVWITVEMLYMTYFFPALIIGWFTRGYK